MRSERGKPSVHTYSHTDGHTIGKSLAWVSFFRRETTTDGGEQMYGLELKRYGFSYWDPHFFPMTMLLNSDKFKITVSFNLNKIGSDLLWLL